MPQLLLFPVLPAFQRDTSAIAPGSWLIIVLPSILRMMLPPVSSAAVPPSSPAQVPVSEDSDGSA